jgi:hypothetical protein
MVVTLQAAERAVHGKVLAELAVRAAVVMVVMQIPAVALALLRLVSQTLAQAVEAAVTGLMAQMVAMVL